MTINRVVGVIAGLVVVLLLINTFALSQLAKGANFHYLNVMHSTQGWILERSLIAHGPESPPSPGQAEELQTNLISIVDQPRACLQVVNVMDRMVMAMIGTGTIVDICRNDVASGERAEAAMASYLAGSADWPATYNALNSAKEDFYDNSVAFKEPVQRTVDFIIMSMTTMAIIFGLAVAVGVFFLARVYIVRPLSGITGAMRRLADGDTNAEVLGTDRGDEIGALAQTFLVFRDKSAELVKINAEDDERRAAQTAERKAVFEKLAGDLESDVGGAVASLDEASQTLSSTASSLLQDSSSTTDAVGVVSSRMEETRASMQAVAGSAQELLASSQAIADQMTASESRLGEAVSATDRTRSEMDGLQEAVTRIGEVVSLIQDIAEQTNLLALNATIEAARAGESGKGFAVVASEVKALANQTSKATDDVRAQIASIQSLTGSAIELISEAVVAIDATQESTNTVASSVQDQAAATREIVETVTRVTHDTEGVNTDLGQVSDGAGRTNDVASNVDNLADTVASSADLLKRNMDRFLETVRAA